MHHYTSTASFGKGAPLLRISPNNSSGSQEHVLAKPKMSVGRDQGCDITIDEDIVSSHHFEVEEQNGLYYLVHPHPQRTDTANGFIYQGRQFQGHEQFRHLLEHGDVFHIGDASGTIVSLTYDDGSTDLRDVLPQIEDVSLHGDTLTIGRAVDNYVCLDHEMVSAHHAQLKKQGAGYCIIDLHSTNHVYVNGLPVSNHQLLDGDVIKIGPFRLVYDEGTRTLRCDKNRTVRIDVQGLYKIVVNKRKEKVLLNNVSLVIPPRSFVALVGSSGAGKSTLLKALSGLNPGVGTVNYNHVNYYKFYAAFSRQLGYVPQDDIVHQELTVRRALYYGAKLRLPNDYTEAMIQARIREVLQEVELEDKRDLPIKALSGGQRKRVSIALELLANPSVFFLDEPTSGLDPGLDRKMMNLLRKLADKGQTVVLVTHATNNINVCDYICFMGDGRLIYFGPPELAKQFFATSDFANIYIALDNKQACERWSEQFHGSPSAPGTYYQTYIADPLQKAIKQHTGTQIRLKRSRQQRPWRQWKLLCQRYIELLINDRRNLGILLLQAPIIALIIFFFITTSIGAGGFDTTKVVQCPRTAKVFTAVGLPDVPDPSSPAVSTNCHEVENILKTTPQGKAYTAHRGGVSQALQDFIVPGPGNAPIILFIMAFAAMMCGCINSVREIIKEDPIYRRERAVNVGIFSYLFSKIAVLGALCLLQSGALLGIISLADPFPHGTFLPGWLEVYITLALTSLAGMVLGLMISALVPNSDLAMSFLPLLLLPQVIFSGTLFPLQGEALQLIGMAFPVRWAMAALGSTVGIHSDKVFGPSHDGDKLFRNNYSYHGTLFSTYSTTDATWHLIHIWFALGITIVVFIAITSLCLLLKDRRSYGHVRTICINKGCRKKLSHPNAQSCPVCGTKQFA